MEHLSLSIANLSLLDRIVKLQPSQADVISEPKDASHIGALKIKFDKGCLQNIKNNFIETSLSCYLCQKNFKQPNDLHDHWTWHKNHIQDLLMGEMIKDSFFSIRYEEKTELCSVSFIVAAKKPAIIERVIYLRPKTTKFIKYFAEDQLPLLIGNGELFTFEANRLLFDIGIEQPIIIAYTFSEYGKMKRGLEQHIVFRTNQFSKCAIDLESRRVPRRSYLVVKKKLGNVFPPKEMVDLSRRSYNQTAVAKVNHDIGQYLLNRKLKSDNYVAVQKFLIQVEDLTKINLYKKIYLKNQVINRSGDEYSVKIVERNDVEYSVSEILSAYDDITVIDTDDRGKSKKHLGKISKIENKTIFFDLYSRKKISTDSVDIRFSPHRVPMLYQYNALQRLFANENVFQILFPIVNFNKTLSNISIKPFIKSIENNEEQLQAVMNISNGFSSNVPYILFGPPGTGKTTTIVESILQLWKTNESSKILVMAGSNSACDEIGSRLCSIFDEIESKEMNLLRIYSESAESRKDNISDSLFEASNLAHGYHFYPSLEVFNIYRIVIVTLTVAGKLAQADIDKNMFTHLFIDECAASTEPETLVGIVGLLSRRGRLILAGDPKQLGPVLQSRHAINFGLETSLMERLLNENLYKIDEQTFEYDKSIQTRLRRNYRSHPGILNLANELFYNKELIPCAPREISEWAIGLKILRSKEVPIIFHSIVGTTQKDVGQTSLKNLDEIKVVMNYVRKLLSKVVKGQKVCENDIGIISPYKNQCSCIRQQLTQAKLDKIDVGPVETFQGREKRIIIISTVRSAVSNLGFLTNPRRINVSITRAQALMIIVGDAETLQKSYLWSYIIEYCKNNNVYVESKRNTQKSFKK